MPESKPKRRWYHLSPDRLIYGLLAVEVFLLLSEWFQWFAFNEKKGWPPPELSDRLDTTHQRFRQKVSPQNQVPFLGRIQAEQNGQHQQTNQHAGKRRSWTTGGEVGIVVVAAAAHRSRASISDMLHRAGRSAR